MDVWIPYEYTNPSNVLVRVWELSAATDTNAWEVGNPAKFPGGSGQGENAGFATFAPSSDGDVPIPEPSSLLVWLLIGLAGGRWCGRPRRA